MEQNHFGEVFGMYLHYEMNLTFDKIVRLTQAACKKFDKPLDRYCSKVLLYNPYVKGEVVKVPRLAPPMHKMAASKKAIEATLNVQSSEEGLIAFVPIHTTSSINSFGVIRGREHATATACLRSRTSWAPPS